MRSVLTRILLFMVVALVSLPLEVNAQNGTSGMRRKGSVTRQSRSKAITKNQGSRKSGSSSSRRSSGSYLKVDGYETTRQSYAPWDGGREWFDVSTNSSSYTVWGVPSWCSIEDKTSKGFYLVYDENYENYDRSDYIEVRTSSKSVRIDIAQDENPVVFNDVTVTHNVMIDGDKNLEIHVDFEVNGMKGEDILVIAQFYQKDNLTELIDPNGDPIFVARCDDATYEGTHWGDFKLYMPNSRMFGARNFIDEITFDVIVADSNGDVINFKEKCGSIVKKKD